MADRLPPRVVRSDLPAERHGRPYTYQRLRCGCEACTAAWSEQNGRYRRNRTARRGAARMVPMFGTDYVALLAAIRAYEHSMRNVVAGRSAMQANLTTLHALCQRYEETKPLPSGKGATGGSGRKVKR